MDGRVRRARLGRAAAWALAAAVALAGCGGSGYSYVSSSSNGTYFKVPKDWKVYDKEQIVGASGAQLSQDQDDGLRYLAVFDGDPKPSLDHDLQTAGHPFGVVRVRRLSREERDTFSLATLRNEVVPVDDIVENELGQIEVLSNPKNIVKPKGLRGTRLVYTVQSEEGSFTVDQTGLVDAGTQYVYFFIVGCETSCFQKNQRTISEIADSWTIKER